MDRNEIRRLQKAARDNNKIALFEWGDQFENQIRNELTKKFDDYYHYQLLDSIDNLLVALCYTALFSESTPELNENNLSDFMDDLFVTIDMFSRGEYSPKDYYDKLKECKINIDDILKNKEKFIEVREGYKYMIDNCKGEDRNANN